MEFESKLIKAGLTGNEAKVYVELLQRGQLSANEVAKKISIDRTLVYTLLNHLIDKGLVGYIIRSNKKFFQVSDTSNLLNSVKEKEIFIADLINDLKNIEKISESVKEISIYEGLNGLRSFIKLAQKHSLIYSFGATGKVYNYLYETPALTKEFSRKGFSAKIITNNKYKDSQMANIKNIDIRYLNIESESTTSIFGDYVSIHLLTSKPIIILIKNKDVAESYKKYFEILWKSAKK